jgi:hypothetical protein
LQRSAGSPPLAETAITPAHIVLGVLRATLGTVPRTLQRAGIDRGELSRRVATAL